jgi:26S proteasome regulatory subunit N10
MRNGDLSPTRFQAQQDACNLICGRKTRSNPETSIGFVASAGKGVEVLVTLSTDIAALLGALHKVEIGGEADFIGSLRVAQLALRHRKNKRQEQRIVMFVGSPLKATENELKRIVLQLKKNNIAVDVVSFGEENMEMNEKKLQVFHEAVNNHDNSHLVSVPVGSTMLSEAISQTPILVEGGASGGTGGETAASDEWGGFGFDPSTDPELAMAIRLSLQQEQPTTGSNDTEMKDVEEGKEGKETEKTPSKPETTQADPMEVDDPDLRAAIALSMETNLETVAQERELTEEEQLALALQLSRQTASADRESDEKKTVGEEKTETKETSGNTEEVTTETTEKKIEKPSENVDLGQVNPEYMASVLLDLPGVDPNDPEVQALLGSLSSQQDEKKTDDGEKK